jgi:hypothetical protein
LFQQFYVGFYSKSDGDGLEAKIFWSKQALPFATDKSIYFCLLSVSMKFFDR